MTSYYVTADWKTLVSEGDPRAAYGIQERDLKRLGLDDQVDGPLVEQSDPEVMRSANLIPEPTAEAPEAKEAEPVEDKEAPKPDDKAVRKPATKGRRST